MNKINLPDYYTDEDKANYHDMISRGEALLGKQIPHCDKFLLDLSARMTINQIKGYQDEKTDDEVKEQQQKHKEAQKHAHIITPDDLYEEGQHPIQLNFYQNYNNSAIQELFLRWLIHLFQITFRLPSRLIY